MLIRLKQNALRFNQEFFNTDFFRDLSRVVFKEVLEHLDRLLKDIFPFRFLG